MSTPLEIHQTWAAHGPAGAVGSIQRSGDNFSVSLPGEDALRGPYDTLVVAKRALHAALGPGAERPEFTEH
jgi:hypothetical protein